MSGALVTHSADIIGLAWRSCRGFEEIRMSTDPVIKLQGRGGKDALGLGRMFGGASLGL